MLESILTRGKKTHARAVALAAIACATFVLAVPSSHIRTRPASETAAAELAQQEAPPRTGEALIRALGCAACHAGLPPPGTTPPPLRVGDPSRDPAQTFVYLRDHDPASDAIDSRMPDFHLDQGEALALALFLSGADAERGRAAAELRTARRAAPRVTSDDGARIFRALGCASCHQSSETATTGPMGPPLGLEGARVRPEWLRAFLRKPSAIRPFGPALGGGRMPNFALTAAEADSIAAFLLRQTVALPAFQPATVSAFAARKVESLLDRRLSCIGCHSLSGRGGRIGPDLARVRGRLQPAFVRQIIEDPGHVVPGTIMPRLPLPRASADLIASYLLQHTAGGPSSAAEPDRVGYLSLLEHHPPAQGTAQDGAGLYGHFCAACHGTSGRGDGFNARYLDAPPARHADAAAMGRRPDDTLYDGIHAGGYILDRSPRMPAFGGTLADEEIRALVAYIRQLCACEQPSWASDGKPAR